MTGSEMAEANLARPGAATPQMREAYLRNHTARIDDTLRRAVALCPGPSASVLDIGRSAVSRALLEVYDEVTTLGLPLDVQAHYISASRWDAPPGKLYAEHLVCDLNNVWHAGATPTARRFDLIVFAEVVEHLHAAPEDVLAWLAALLKPGGFLLCTTPNAASLGKRLKLAAGRNPYERLRRGLDNADNPGHIREYTRNELFEIGKAAGLCVVDHEYTDYFDPGRRVTAWPRAYAAHGAFLLWRAFARYQVIVYRR
jgi:SAM-dependent methyltransferase